MSTASDAETTGPIDPKQARAVAKAAKAHAKALRPWYKKKRFILSGVIVLLIIIIVAASSGSKSPSRSPDTQAAAKSTGSSGPSTTAASPTTTAPPGCATAHATYADEQSTDCVALPNGTVAIANTTVTATWSRKITTLGNSICAAVSIVNHNTDTISYNSLDWKLQTPAGSVVTTNFQGTPYLGSGTIVAGGTASGNVCFKDPGQPGTYVGIYKPDPFQPNRGIWLFTP